MFEFGKDLRRIFIQAREAEDRAWLELISADLLEVEARQQSIDAGRVSCRKPAHAWLKACDLWMEHARRTGRRASVAKAIEAAEGARAASGRDLLDGDLALARVRLLDHDLRGDPTALDLAEAILKTVGEPQRPIAAARLSMTHALVRSRRARVEGTPSARRDAAALLDAALHAARGHAALLVDRGELMLERAVLTLDAGVALRDPRLLDQAGRDLGALVAACPDDQRPITRARALTLCAAGMSALAAVAGDGKARDQARALFEAAADAFTPDHSPLDWIGVVLARSTMEASQAGPLHLAVRLSQGEGLVLGALARHAQQSGAVDRAASRGDKGRLRALEAEIMGRIATAGDRAAPLDWAADQLALAQARLALRQADPKARPDLQACILAVVHAGETAHEYGCSALSARASLLTAALRTVAPRP